MRQLPGDGDFLAFERTLIALSRAPNSNFGVKHLEDLLARKPKYIPAVDQIVRRHLPEPPCGRLIEGSPLS